MKRYDNATDGLKLVLRHWSAGCTAWVGFPAEERKLDALDTKWAEIYGTRLPPHARHARRKRGQPTALALAHRAPMGKWQAWLLRTDGDDGDPGSPWRHEKWIRTPPVVGPKDAELRMVMMPRLRRDYRWTWVLSDRHLNMIGSHLRTLVKAGNAGELVFALHSTMKGLPMFGGVRQQLRKEITSQERLWKRCWQDRPWPWPPAAYPWSDGVPMMGGYRSAVTEGSVTSQP